MGVPTIAWVLPRPSKSKYPGSVPLHFEKKLLRHLGVDPATAKILQPFGGMGEYGIRCDLRETHPLAAMHGDKVIWKRPDYICDAHDLSPFADNTFDLVFLDPPYSKEEAETIYAAPPPVYKRYIAAAVRVAKPGGFIASYNVVMTPRPDGTTYHSRIMLGTRVWHRLRACCIFQKAVQS